MQKKAAELISTSTAFYLPIPELTNLEVYYLPTGLGVTNIIVTT
jgi:hypothetical protein